MKSTVKSLSVRMTEFEQLIDVRPRFRDILRFALPDHYFLVEVALNEALNNAFLHGSKAAAGDVELKIRVTDRKLIIRVKNKGDGFAGNQLLKQMRNSPENPFEERLSGISGRGLPIMNSVFNCMTYNRKGTEVLLVKARS